MRARVLGVAAAAAFSALSACGSSGSGSSSPSGGGTISGTIVKGPVHGATVTAYAVANGSMGAQLGQTTSDSSGNFTVPVGSSAGPVMLQAAGGSYADEATGASMSMLAGDVMTSAVSMVTAGGSTTGVQVTPLTSMAQAAARSMPGGMTPGNIDTANGEVGTYFSVTDIVHTAPMDPTTADSGSGASNDARNYGMAIAAMSQYAKTMGMTSSSAMVTAMMDDASDGVMNGMMGSTAIPMGGMGGMMGTMMSPSAGTTDLSQAMATFVGSAMNRSGVTVAEMQSVIDRLAASNGSLAGTSP